jgi:hypothetical protein
VGIVQEQPDQARNGKNPKCDSGQLAVDKGEVDRREEYEPQCDVQKLRMGIQLIIFVARREEDPSKDLHMEFPVNDLIERIPILFEYNIHILIGC